MRHLDQLYVDSYGIVVHIRYISQPYGEGKDECSIFVVTSMCLSFMHKHALFK